MCTDHYDSLKAHVQKVPVITNEAASSTEMEAISSNHWLNAHVLLFACVLYCTACVLWTFVFCLIRLDRPMDIARMNTGYSLKKLLLERLIISYFNILLLSNWNFVFAIDEDRGWRVVTTHARVADHLYIQINVSVYSIWQHFETKSVEPFNNLNSSAVKCFHSEYYPTTMWTHRPILRSCTASFTYRHCWNDFTNFGIQFSRLNSNLKFMTIVALSKSPLSLYFRNERLRNQIEDALYHINGMYTAIYALSFISILLFLSSFNAIDPSIQVPLCPFQQFQFIAGRISFNKPRKQTNYRRKRKKGN